MLSSVDNGSMMFMCVGGIPQWKVDQLKGRWHSSWKVGIRAHISNQNVTNTNGTVQFFYVLLFSLTRLVVEPTHLEKDAQIKVDHLLKTGWNKNQWDNTTGQTTIDNLP